MGVDSACARIGLQVRPEEFARLVDEAVDQMLPARRVTAPAEELSPDEARILEEGGVTLRPRAIGTESPLVRSAAEYAALLATSLAVPDAARRLGVDGSRVRQRLAAHTLYGVKLPSGWRLPAFQFTETGLLPGFERIAPRLVGVHPVAVARWLDHPHVDLTLEDVPVAPRTWLEVGLDPDVVVTLADELRGVA